MSNMQHVRHPTHNELLAAFLNRIDQGEFGPYDVAGIYSGRFDMPIQFVLRDQRSLLVELVNLNRDGSIIWGQKPRAV